MTRFPTAIPVLALAAALSASAADRYEAEDAIVDPNTVAKTADAKASGGYFVNMKGGDLSFTIRAPQAGFFVLWAGYSQPYDANGKIQNLYVNGAAAGQIAFAYTTGYATLKAAARLKLRAGANQVEIRHSWGWVNLDYLELGPYVPKAFDVTPTLATPKPSENARKVYGFLRDRFQSQVVSGFMTNTVMANDGKYTPDSVEGQEEAAWIKKASGKLPALMGVDFLHATGKNSEQAWYRGYTQATLALAAEMFGKGGIPAYCWHWMDPSRTDEAFYTASGNASSHTAFDLGKAFTDTTYAAFDTASAEYQAIVRDLDAVAGHLGTLAQKGVPVLWRPLHEASGRWFWWGAKGPKPCKALWKLMFDRFTVRHRLDNLIWVWTTDEAGDALDWYPGDAYVDIIGRDFYYYPRVADHASLAGSFEKLKDLFGVKKLITLSENGSIPDPDSMKAEGAGWSYFMPWYGDYTMDGRNHDNTAADWKAFLNDPYVITLDEMPGWDKYVPPAGLPRAAAAPGAAIIRLHPGWLEIVSPGRGGAGAEPPEARAVDLFDLRGTRAASLPPAGPGRFALPELPPGIYQARARMGGATVTARLALVPR